METKNNTIQTATLNKTVTENKKIYTTSLELSIRRKKTIGLPGDDASLHNIKIGSALKGNGVLRGLDYDEERKYLPEVIGISPTDNEWRRVVKDYWSNISVAVPADGIGTNKLQGKYLKFTIEFTNMNDKELFEKSLSFDIKSEVSKKGTIVEGIDDYILWRYCLVYSKVANDFKDINKSPKISFYLYSEKNKVLNEHKAFKLRIKANNEFAKILMDENKLNAVLLMFGENLSTYKGEESKQNKHLVLEALIKTKPAKFIAFVEDGNLEVKSLIKRAVEAHIIHQPANTDSYYFGENNEVTLGTTLMDAVIYWKSTDTKNKEIVDAIKARLKQI